ncbi:MAG: TrkH family potassium uptake protein [Candidatus Omnitrophica bacterium]|nr:TrkH family potassium uptake protein [Candidatus Omnitrophota bacterium]MDD5574043.1 TrkH family potassium uptake protein [Candidatus Omnitrophota bacterium]
MILKPQSLDIRIILHFLGKIVLGFGVMMVLPVAISLVFGETAPVIDFAIGLVIAISVGIFFILMARLDEHVEMSWMHGMVVVSLGWLVCMVLGAVPFFLSGHWASFLDACFESMSGLATTGLTLAQDLDHLSHAANFWRHLLMFLGGQGIVVVALSFLVKGGPGAFRMYVGEGRDEKILPNVVETAKFIWLVSLVYFGLGTLLLALCGYFSVGLSLREAVFHGACIFMAAFDTGGFSPQSQGVIYYQSPLFELCTIVVMVWGAINFNLHYAIWNGKRKELWRDLETRTFLITLSCVTLLAAAALVKGRVYGDLIGLGRRGLYQIISAHTTTGFSTIYPQQFMLEWKSLALLGIILAMGMGASICSTTGGIKMMRIGLIGKAFREDIKRFLISDSSVVSTKFHHLKDLFLDDKMVRSAALMTIAYVLVYLFGTAMACFAGYPVLESLFESTSAAGNVGLSCGITQATMPAFLKVVYIVQMWAGRLEFISILVLGGFFVSCIRGK